MELRDLIVEQVDPDELIDVLGLTTEDLVDALWEYITENRDRFAYLYMDDERCYDGSDDNLLG